MGYDGKGVHYATALIDDEESGQELKEVLTALRNEGRVDMGGFSDNASPSTKADRVSVLLDELIAQL